MVVINIKHPFQHETYSIDNWTAQQLDKIKALINKKDRDYVIIIDGEEGTGKSTFASQIAYYVDRTFNMERMCLTPSDFKEKIANAEKGQAVVFDEAYTGLASRTALSEINKSLVEMMMEMRKKNLFVILCIPSFFYLEKYAALHRARALFHCYFKDGNPGRYLVYNQKKMRMLYLVGKKKMSYNFPSVHKKCKFWQGTPLDWTKYEEKKITALKGKQKTSRTEKQQLQRNFLCWLWLKKGFSLRELESESKRYEIEFSDTAIREAARDFVKKHRTDYSNPIQEAQESQKIA